MINSQVQSSPLLDEGGFLIDTFPIMRNGGRRGSRTPIAGFGDRKSAIDLYALITRKSDISIVMDRKKSTKIDF